MVGIQIAGNLIAPDMTSLLLTSSIKGQAPEDFGLTKTDKLADEIATAWGDAKAYWAAFKRSLSRLAADDLATTITRELWAVPLLRSLGYSPVYTAKAEVVEGQTYAISHRAEPGENKPPIQIIGCRVEVDLRPPSGTPRLSAHGLVQEYLNKTEHLWAIATNGLRWRLLRDSSLMTRLTYIEFDLEQILESEDFASFGLFYRLFHRSRLPQGMDDADKCLLEYYHQEALQQGGRVRDRLRDGVEEALKILGTGFLQHPKNEHLRQKFSNNYELRTTNYELTYYRQLLRLIYRLLFLMVAESRDLLLIGEDSEKARIYREYYSIERLRASAERPRWRREGFQDVWQGLRVTFLLFDENWRGELLGLSPLNGDLFGSSTLPDLSDCAIDNYDLLLAIRHLSLYQDKGQSRRVNYAALDVEELGSIYESLLDFHPQIIQRQGIYQFALVFGSDRKTTGSYYTPPQLVQQLIKTALEPVIAEKIRDLKSNYELQITNYELEKALLSLKVVDPACGSGHFLLAAARRIGKELARIRTGEAEPGQEPLRAAIRDVIQNCIYGVDLNPLAVDLCKVALWIEGFTRGKPLNFLDHRIKCGNSLVGVMDLSCLDEGIPDEAFKAVTGDSKQLSTQFKKRNKQERNNKDQLSIGDFQPEREQYAESWRELGEIAETTPKEVKQKEQQYKDTLENAGWKRDYWACNLWTAAFFMPLTQANLQLLPTTAALSRLIRNSEFVIRNSEENCELKGEIGEIVAAANKLAEEKHFFHWALEFPEVFNPEPTNYELRITNYELKSGFDCVLGNPPWERIKLQEKEFFGSRSFEIANAANKAVREKLIKELPKLNPDLAQAWEEAKHDAEAQSKFIRESVRFPLTAVGDINTYAVFAETVTKIVNDKGKIGIIIPSGIATDDTYKQFFKNVFQLQSLDCIYAFNNRVYFKDVGLNQKLFILLTLCGAKLKVNLSKFAFHLSDIKETNEVNRVFSMSVKDIALLNPNTLTCPVFRTRTDAEITKKIYQRVPVLENERTEVNPWGISFMRMFDMSNDSGLFIIRNSEFVIRNSEDNDKLGTTNYELPLYEAKMFHQFDHRWATYSDSGDTRDLTDVEKSDSTFQVKPRYWVNRNEVENKLGEKWKKGWLLGFRRISNNTNERTYISSIFPQVGCGDSVFLMMPRLNNALLTSCLYSSLNSLVLDFVTRQKMGGTNLNFFIVKQLPVIPPEAYTQQDIKFISTRVLELVYTAWDMQPFAQDMWNDSDEKMRELIVKQWQANQTASAQPPKNYELRIKNYELQTTNYELSASAQPPENYELQITNYELQTTNYELSPFIWNPNRRALLRAELDAYYAKLYGLTRDELRYILDPADVYGADFPSETFRVLKNNEIKQFGEYRTQRLVLEAWDKMFK